MKKYPYVFLGIFIAILIFIIIHIISVPIKTNRYIKVKTISNLNEGLEKYETKIDKVKNEDCKNSLYDMADRIRNTYYTNDVSLKYYYENYFVDDYKFEVYYKNVLDKCSLENDANIYAKLLESMEFPYEMKNKYLGSYQISFSDLLIMDEDVKRVEELGTYSNKLLEMEVLSDLISEVSKK